MSAKRRRSIEVATTVAARGNLSELLNRVAYGKRRILLTRRNRPLAAVVPVEDVERLEQLEDHEDLKAARRAIREVEREGTVAWSKIKKELGLK